MKTNHKNLISFITIKELINQQIARWAIDLVSYNIIIQYIPRKDNLRVDTLSQKPSYKGDK